MRAVSPLSYPNRRSRKRQPDAPAGGSVVQTLNLTAAATSGTHYFSGIATVFAQGEVPGNLSTDLPGCQVEVLQRWNDGSVSNARISGHASFTQNVAKTVQIRTGTPPSGTALTQAGIPAGARGLYTISWGTDTVTFQPWSDTPEKTYISGHEVSEWHFVQDLGTTNCLARLYVRRFADDRIECLPFIENPFLDNSAHTALASSTDQTKTVAFVLNGSTVFNNGGATLTLYKNTRFKGRENWYTAFGTDPQIVPSHSPASLKASKKFPNYDFTPNATCLNAQDTTYAAMSNGPIAPQMGAQGDHPGIAPLPEWTVSYIASGDSRGWNAMLVGSSSLNSYAICYRRKSTGEVIKPSDFSTWTVNGPGAGGSNDTFAGPLQWELSHHTGEGYGASLLTGDRWHYDTMLFNAATVYLCNSSSQGSGTSRLMRNQTRAVAWALRTLSLVSAASTDADRAASTPAADFRSMLSSNITSAKTILQGGGEMAEKGCFYQFSYGNGSNGTWPDLTGTDLGCVAPWMWDFGVAGLHVGSDAQPLASMTDYNLVRDLVSPWSLGRLGATGDTAQFGFVRAALYGMQVATDGTGATWLNTWGDIYTNTVGSSNSSTSNTLLGSSGSDPANAPTGYWGYLSACAAMCADHGETGAAAAWLRLTGATNWSTANSGFDTHPAWGIRPRTTVVDGSNPAWFSSRPNTTQWYTVPSTSYAAAQTSFPNPGATLSQGIGSGKQGAYFWSGAVYSPVDKSLYHGLGGGHTNYGGNEMAKLVLTNDTLAWQLLLAPTTDSLLTYSQTPYTQSPDDRPTSRHKYWNDHFVASTKGGRTNRIMFIGAGSLYGPVGGTSWQVDGWDIAGGVYDPKQTYSNTGGGFGYSHSAGMSQCQDAADNVYCLVQNNAWLKWIAATDTWSQFGTTMTVSSGYAPSAVDTSRNELLVIGGDSDEAKLYTNLNTSPVENNVTFTGTSAGIGKNGGQLIYVPTIDKYLFFRFDQADSNVYAFTRVSSTSFSVAVFSVSGTPPTKATNGSGADAFHSRFGFSPDFGTNGIVYFTGGTTSDNFSFFRL